MALAIGDEKGELRARHRRPTETSGNAADDVARIAEEQVEENGDDEASAADDESE